MFSTDSKPVFLIWTTFHWLSACPFNLKSSKIILSEPDNNGLLFGPLYGLKIKAWDLLSGKPSTIPTGSTGQMGEGERGKVVLHEFSKFDCYTSSYRKNQLIRPIRICITFLIKNMFWNEF